MCINQHSKSEEIAMVNAIKDSDWRVGNYLRLSHDSDYNDSDSIENQRKLAREYVYQCSNLIILKEYVDDGQTGTHFERTALLQMITDLKQNVINCVIVKDLSRFGRDYLQTGKYLEKIFPTLGVRFISILDNYDSINFDRDNGYLLISLKNLLHEMYAKDISKKVKSTYQLKQENKIFYRSATIPYGYMMEPKLGNYCIDEAAANIVRHIFLQYSQGKSKYSIRQDLFHRQILTPRQYQKTGQIYQCNNTTQRMWSLSTIHRILINSVYIGTMTYHKTEQSLYRNKKRTSVPVSEWIAIKGNHPAIIVEALYHNVQNKLQFARNAYMRKNECNSSDLKSQYNSVAFQIIQSHLCVVVGSCLFTTTKRSKIIEQKQINNKLVTLYQQYLTVYEQYQKNVISIHEFQSYRELYTKKINHYQSLTSGVLPVRENMESYGNYLKTSGKLIENYIADITIHQKKSIAIKLLYKDFFITPNS
jgi:DNA invertase Pin-like site-specific DNA recombinase